MALAQSQRKTVVGAGTIPHNSIKGTAKERQRRKNKGPIEVSAVDLRPTKRIFLSCHWLDAHLCSMRQSRTTMDATLLVNRFNMSSYRRKGDTIGFIIKNFQDNFRLIEITEFFATPNPLIDNIVFAFIETKVNTMIESTQTRIPWKNSVFTTPACGMILLTEKGSVWIF